MQLTEERKFKTFKGLHMPYVLHACLILYGIMLEYYLWGKDPH
jgi:hypothetical protein